MKVLRGLSLLVLLSLLVPTSALFANDGVVECARLMSSTAPKCWWLSGYSYTFAIQNRFNGPVSSLSMVSDTPAGMTFKPNVIAVSPPLQYGQTRTFTITTANTRGASQACFRVTLHSADFTEHGSIRVCVPLKRCWWDSSYDAPPASALALREPRSGAAGEKDPAARLGSTVDRSHLRSYDDPICAITALTTRSHLALPNVKIVSNVTPARR